MTAVAVTRKTVFQHDPGCRFARDTRGGHEDAAKRISDTYMLHRVAGAGLGLSNVGKVFAARLDDGTSDGVLYDTRRDAIRHQHHNEKFYAYYRIGREGMTVCNAAAVLRIHRHVYDAGIGFTDEDDMQGAEIIPRLTIEDNNRLLGALAARTWIPGRKNWL